MRRSRPGCDATLKESLIPFASQPPGKDPKIVPVAASRSSCVPFEANEDCIFPVSPRVKPARATAANINSPHPVSIYCILYKPQNAICGRVALDRAARICAEGTRFVPIKALGIVIPTHNRIDALLECLAHLERQTFTDFEV